jgi:glycyl-tRNA synthetase beta chain
MTDKNLLIELGTEELPPKALKKLAEAFANSFEKDLQINSISYNKVEWFATPRRLAVIIKNAATKQPDKIIEKKGPSLSAAYINGKPTPAAEGWAKSNGITVEQADTLKTEKGEWLVYKANIPGKNTSELIPEFTSNAIKSLPIPKLMHWGDTKYEFVRPIHTVCILFGEQLIHANILGVESSTTIRGHRYMGSPEITLSSADEYIDVLRKNYVIADYNERRNIIKSSIINEANKLNGTADLDESLIDEVTSLVEWPCLLTATFEEKFLKVPSEALVYTMKGDQKYFPVYNKEGKLLPNFIFISNIESKDPSQVIKGNERVVRPRLSDAEFFFNTDKKIKLINRLESLDSVLFQKQLGTLKERSERISKLASYIATKIEGDADLSARAGLLSKCDLMTNMVMEFTDTQGVMGMHYARHDGENEKVAIALFEQYLPRFAGDQLPTNDVSYSVSLADKFDTLVGIFGINMPPKGDKDPFGLRRASIGVIRIIVEKELKLDLLDLIDYSKNLYGDKLINTNVTSDVFEYILGRFKAHYQDQEIRTDVILAVLARKPSEPYDFHKRVVAVNSFLSSSAAPSLVAANKRVSNILTKLTTEIPNNINSNILKESQEKSLAECIISLKSELKEYFDNKDYGTILSKLSSLKEPIDDFFNNVRVMDDDEQTKINRLAILSNLRNLFLNVADISLLQM